MNKKEAYDQLIEPRLRALSSICREYGISLLVHLSVDEQSDGNERRTIALADQNGHVPCEVICALLEMNRHAGISVDDALQALQVVKH